MKYIYRRFIYRRLMKLMHRYNLHHMKVLQLEVTHKLHKCQWCGISDRTLTAAGHEAIGKEMCNKRVAPPVTAEGKDTKR